MDIDLKKIFKEMRKGAREISKSYIAAFLDGEGCLNIWTTNTGALAFRIRFDQSDTKILKKIQEKYGGTIYETKRMKKDIWKTNHTLDIFRINDTEKLLVDIYPYVIGKRKQVGVAFIYLWMKDRFRIRKGAGHMPKDIKKLLIMCKKLMNMLNKPGVKTAELEENIERSIKELLYRIGDLKKEDRKQLKLF